MHFLGKLFPEKGVAQLKLAAIGKRESKNDVVWITLQAQQFKWKKVNIPNVTGYGTDTMYIFYDNPNHRGKFFKLDTVQDMENTITSVPIVVMLPSIIVPVFCGERGL